MICNGIDTPIVIFSIIETQALWNPLSQLANDITSPQITLQSNLAVSEVWPTLLRFLYTQRTETTRRGSDCQHRN